MEALDHQRKNLVLILPKWTQNFIWVCIIMVIIVICLLLKIIKFIADIKNVNFPTQFCLGRFLMDLVLPILEKYL